jgi:hypothetical protein
LRYKKDFWSVRPLNLTNLDFAKDQKGLNAKFCGVMDISYPQFLIKRGFEDDCPTAALI